MPDDLSVVTKPKELFDIARLLLQTEFERFLDNPVTQALEAVTGAFALGTKQLGVSAGKMAQAIVKGQMYEQLAEEWKTLREAGKIPDNLGETKHGLYTWAELMSIVDEECPDSDKLDALKAAFYAVNKTNQTDSEQIVAYQLWQIAKELKSGDVLLLRAVYGRVSQSPADRAHEWVTRMSEISGLVIPELLKRHETRLTDLLLLTPRVKTQGDMQLGYEGSGINSQNNRLTQLGIHFCRNIETYRIEIEEARRGSECDQ